MPKDLSSFVAIDFEKMNSNQTSVCEVGMVKYKDGQEIERFHSLIRPAKGLVWGEKYRSLLSHIKDKELLNAPTFRDLHSNMCQFVGKEILICHNAAADMNYIFYCEREAGVKSRLCKSGYIDTQEMAKQILGPENKGLFPCCRLLLHKDPVNHHCAVDDASSCAEVFCAFQQLQDWRKYYHKEKYKPSKDKLWDKRGYDETSINAKICETTKVNTDFTNLLFDDKQLPFYNFQNKRVIVTSTGNAIKKHIQTCVLTKLGATYQGESVNSRTDVLIVGTNEAGWRKMKNAIIQKRERPDSFMIFSAQAFLDLYDADGIDVTQTDSSQIATCQLDHETEDNSDSIMDNAENKPLAAEKTGINWSGIISGIITVFVVIGQILYYICIFTINILFMLFGIKIR